MANFWIIFSALLFIYSCVVSYYCIKFGLILIRIEDLFEESLEEISQSLANFNEILEKPIFFDSVEVRQCISEIKKTRNMIINISKKMISISNYNQEDIENTKDTLMYKKVQ